MKIFKEMLWHVILLTVSVLFVLAVRAIDRSFPVLKDFEVTSQQITDVSVIIEGKVNKVRDCKLLEINAFTPEGRKLAINFLDRPIEENQGTRPVGIQFWGPGELFNQNNTSINIFITHSCSVFWSQTTKLTTLTLVKVPESENLAPAFKE